MGPIKFLLQCGLLIGSLIQLGYAQTQPSPPKGDNQPKKGQAKKLSPEEKADLAIQKNEARYGDSKITEIVSEEYREKLIESLHGQSQVVEVMVPLPVSGESCNPHEVIYDELKKDLKLPCFESYLDAVVNGEGLKKVKSAYRAMLKCTDDCRLDIDLDFLTQCYDWDLFFEVPRQRAAPV